MNVYFSNRIERLFEALMGNLYAHSSPFAKRLVMVATPPLKTWVMLELAEKAGIAAGLEIGTVDETFRKLLKPSRPFPKAEEMALALEMEILKVLADPFPDEKWDPLIRYLGKDRKKITPFSFELAKLFQKYNLYGNKLGPEWDRGGWQRALWDRLFGLSDSPWVAPYREYAEKEPLSISQGSLDVFAVSFLPKVQLDFLQRAAQKIPVRTYCLSPCESFWSDLAGPREKGGGAEFQIDQPLLANFGKVGRMMAKWIEESPAQTFELYSHKEAKTLLEHLQEDMQQLRNYRESAPCPLDSDGSVQIHGAPSLLREVEIVQQALLQIVAQGGVEPRDILVMAPDISTYAPFIPAIFDGEFFTAHVSDLRLPALEPLIQQFLQLVAFAQGRWSSRDFLALLESPFFYKKLRWNKQETLVVKEWIENCAIRWGEDGEHRIELLKSLYGEGEDSHPYEPGTWDFGLQRLLAGLIQTSHPSLIPYAQIESTQGQLLGELIDLLQNLKKDLRVFSDGTELSLTAWGEQLKALFDAYFYYKGAEEQADSLFKITDFFRRIGMQFERETVPFPTVQKHLEYALSQSSTRYKETNLQAVRFCSLLPLRTVPAKVVVLMGMEEGAFPRPETPLSFDLLHQNPLADFCPTRGDMDRFIFLEALLSARQAILFTYQAKNPADFKEQSPCLLIDELLNAVELGYQTHVPHLIHPLNRFDKSYFVKGSSFKSFSGRDYADAQTALAPKSSPHRFIVEFPLPSGDIEPAETLRFEDLRGFIKDPLKAYFNKTLGIYLEGEKQEKQEPFIHTSLEFSSLKRNILRRPLEEVLASAEKEGILPIENFQDSTQTRLKEELEALNAFGIVPETIEEVDFCLPLSLKLSGKLPLVTPEGLLVLKGKSKATLIDAWPSFLVYLALKRGKPRLLFLKDGAAVDGTEIRPEEELEKLIAYYQGGIKAGSPLDPLLIAGKESYSEYMQWLQREGGFTLATAWKQEAERLFGSILEEA